MSPHEELSPEVAPRAYLNQPPWKRIVVIAAGPAMNLLIAFLLGWAIIAFHGVAVNDLVVDQVQTTSAAANQLRPGDKVLSIDGVPGYQSGLSDQEIVDRQLRLRRVVSRHACAGTPTAGCKATTPAKVVVQRDGKPMTLLITPQYDAAAKRMLLGITYGANEHVGPAHAVTITATNLWRITRLTTSSIVRIFYDPKARKDVSGVVGSYEATRQSFQFDTDPGAEHPRDHLALPRGGESLPLPAPRRRPYLLGRGREDPRASDPLPPDRAGLGRRLHARRLPLRRRPDQRHRPAARAGVQRPLS